MKRITPQQENDRMLAKLLGLDESEAARKLNARVRIVASAVNDPFAAELIEQLERTVHVVRDGRDCDLEVSIGVQSSHPNALFIKIDDTSMVISREALALSLTTPHPLQAAIAACFAAGAVLRTVVPEIPGPKIPDPFVVRFEALGAQRSVVERPILMDDPVLIGAGAIANGFIRACRHINVSGRMTVCDPKLVGAGNPNRCLYFDENDVDAPKASRLCEKAQSAFPNLDLRPVDESFEAVVKRRGRVRRAIVAADSRRVRRSIQDLLPLEVLDASTTDASEVIVHSHRQPTSGVCLACVYREIPDELAREKDIAAGLGLEVADIAANPLITDSVARRIVASHPQLDAPSLVNVAFDSLFKQLCGQQALHAAHSAQVLAPFAFVSNLAGALLTLELLRFETDRPTTNYMCLSPWAAPHTMVRSWRNRNADCKFCGRETSQRALRTVWPDIV